MEWQKKLLSSPVGQEKKKFWSDLLQEAELKSTDQKYLSDVMNNPEDEFISQKVVITGEEYEGMRWLVRSTNLPLSAILLTLHQHIMNICFEERNYLQMVRVDGRERIIDEFAQLVQTWTHCLSR